MPQSLRQGPSGKNLIPLLSVKPRTHCRTERLGPSRVSRHRRPTHLQEKIERLCEAKYTPENASKMGQGRGFAASMILILKSILAREDLDCSSTNPLSLMLSS